MNHKDHVNLLQKGIPEKGGTWADLGSGTGAFTLALADLIGPTGKIYTIDKDKRALKEQEKAMRANFPTTTVEYITADFTRRLDLPKLDGIIMANSLHFVRHKDPVLQLIRSYLRPGGRFILVEYNTDRGNMWVPIPSLTEHGKSSHIKTDLQRLNYYQPCQAATSAKYIPL